MLTGAYSPRGDLPPGVLERMMTPLRAYPADQEGVWADQHSALGARLLNVWKPFPARALELVGSGVRVAFLGRLDNREEIARALREPPERCDSELVAAGYARWADALPSKLDGDFALAIIDPARQSLLLARDAMGTVPLYVLHVADVCVFSSVITSLQAYPGVRLEPDLHALAESVVGAGRLRVDQTFFAGVHAVPPGEVWVCDAGGTRRTTFSDFDRTVSPVRSFDEAKACYRAALTAAVHRRMSRVDRAVFLLSGGLDSSSLYCLASHLYAEGRGGEPVAVTYTESNGGASDESQYIAAVDRHTGRKTHRVDLSPVDFTDLNRRYAAFAEAPLLLPNPGTFMRVAEFVRACDARLQCVGVFGDQVNAPYPPGHFVELFRRLRWLRMWREQREIERWFVDVPPADLRRDTARFLLRHHVPAALKELRRRLRNPKSSAPFYTQRLKDAIAGVAETPGTHVPHSMRRLYELVRSPLRLRGIEVGYRLDAADAVQSCYPFFDRDLVQTVLGIPAEYQFRGGVPRALQRFSLVGEVPAEVLQRREKGDYTEPISAGIAADRDVIVREIVNGRAVAMGLIDGDAVKREHDRWRRDAVDNPEIAFYLHEWWELEQFLARSFPQPAGTS